MGLCRIPPPEIRSPYGIILGGGSSLALAVPCSCEGGFLKTLGKAGHIAASKAQTVGPDRLISPSATIFLLCDFGGDP